MAASDKRPRAIIATYYPDQSLHIRRPLWHTTKVLATPSLMPRVSKGLGRKSVCAIVAAAAKVPEDGDSGHVPETLLKCLSISLCPSACGCIDCSSAVRRETQPCSNALALLRCPETAPVLTLHPELA